MPRILIVDDDPAFCLMMGTFLSKNGFMTERALSGKECLSTMKKDTFDLVLTDLRLPDLTGIDLLKEIKSVDPELPVILMTGYGDIRTAVQAIKLGAYEYVTKPINPDEILLMVEAVFGEEPKGSKRASHSPEDFNYLIGESTSAQKLEEYIALVAPTNMSVLIRGESGTGKEYVARKIHHESERRNRPFVALDCGAISNELAASELFGHLKGSFTGAISDKVGQFEAANGGTLFLDEIGNLSYEVQIKLLRAIQERKIKMIGGRADVTVDVRIIAASNEDLKEAVREKGFREDLYHRLNEFILEVPSLRDRGRDIDLFARNFLDQSNEELNKNIRGFSPEVHEMFHEYSWPGNIRELKNVIRRAVLLSKGPKIEKEHIPAEILYARNARPATADNTQDLRGQTESQEREIIINTLEKTRYNKSKAAQILKIDRKTLYNKMKHYNIEG